MEAKGIDVVTPYGLKTALLGHPAVAEPGLIGRADELRGEVISAFVVLKQGLIPLDKFLERRKTVTEEQKKLIRRIRSIWFDSSYDDAPTVTLQPHQATIPTWSSLYRGLLGGFAARSYSMLPISAGRKVSREFSFREGVRM